MAVLADILEAFEVADTLPDGDRQKAIIAAADRAIALAGAETIALSDSGSLAESRLTNPGHWLAYKANISKPRGRGSLLLPVWPIGSMQWPKRSTRAS